MPGLVAIVGPTATGKSALALSLTSAIGGEIVNADSRQVYRHMDVGTAKPTPEERSRVPHHLYDIVDPDGPFNLALYLQKARQAVSDIRERGKTPLLVGGTGLYVWGFLEGMSVPHVPPNSDLRSQLEAEAATAGPQALHQRLADVDPEAAASIDPRNVRRVVRALEVYEATGAPFSQQVRREGLDYPVHVVGLTADRALIHERADSRVEAMFDEGLVDEVQRLLDRGYPPNLPAMTGVGYKQVVPYLNGECTIGAAIKATKIATHRLVRHQYAWFKSEDPRIDWYDIGGRFADRVLSRVERFVSESGNTGAP